MEAPMAAIPDRDTLVLRAPDWRSPAQLVTLARRELAPSRRPLTPSLADVGRSPAERRLASFRERYPAPFERVHAGIWWAVANGAEPPPAGQPARHPCGWSLVLAWHKRYRGAAPWVDQLGRLLLGDPCPSCQAALGWWPPRPKPRARATRAARSSTSTRTRRQHPAGTTWRGVVHRSAGVAHHSRNSAPLRERRVAMVADARPRLDPATAAYNAAACRRMGVDPAHYPHLTGDR
jgi:hypothetical protein